MAICDFCSAPHPTWLYPADSFEMRRDGWGSTADWAACEECSALIEAKQHDAVVNTRMMMAAMKSLQRSGLTGLSRAELRIVEEKTRHLYARFRKSRAGPRKLLDAA